MPLQLLALAGSTPAGVAQRRLCLAVAALVVAAGEVGGLIGLLGHRSGTGLVMSAATAASNNARQICVMVCSGFGALDQTAMLQVLAWLLPHMCLLLRTCLAGHFLLTFGRGTACRFLR